MEENGSKLRTSQEQDKARNMLRKAINHVIQAKRKDKKLGEALKKKGYGQQLKSYIHTPKTSNPRYGTKEKKMEGMNTTLYFWIKEKNQEALTCFCVFWERNMVRKEGKKCPNSSQKPIFSVLVQFRVAHFPRHGTPSRAANSMA